MPTMTVHVQCTLYNRYIVQSKHDCLIELQLQVLCFERSSTWQIGGPVPPAARLLISVCCAGRRGLVSAEQTSSCTRTANHGLIKLWL